MKHYTKLFFAAAVAALGLASCAKEVAPVETPKDNLVTVHFGATAGIEGATKATLTPNEQETLFTSAWENGDVISIKYENGETKPTTTTGTWNGTKFEATMPSYTGMWEYTACYPNPVNEEISFGANRTQKGNLYNSNYDVMIAPKISCDHADAGKDDSGNDVIFNMERKTGIVYFHLRSELNEDVISAKLSVEGGNIASSYALLDPSGFTCEKDLKEITITFEEGTAPKASDFQLWYNVLPTMYTKMTLTVETTGHTMTISRNAPNIDEYVAGKLYKVVKNIDDKWVAKGGETPGTNDFVLVTSAQSDWSGSYLLVGTNDVNYYAFDESIYEDKTWGKCSEVVVKNNTISSTYGTMALEIVPGTTENTYSVLTPSGKYLSASAKGAFNLLDKYAANNCDFTISFGENNAIVIKKASSTNMQIRYNYNGGKGGLRWYDGASVNPVYLYKGPSVAKYSVSCSTVEGGEIFSTLGKCEEGTEVTLTASARPGYKFGEWSVVAADGTVINVVDNKFTMPAQDVTVSCAFVKISYTITKAPAVNGSFTVKLGDTEVNTAQFRDKLTLTATPNEGYSLEKWTVTYMDGETEKSFNPSGTFTMPAANVTVSASFVEAASIPVYASLTELIAAGKPTTTGTKVTVTLTDEEITDLHKVSGGKYTNGVFFMVGTQEVEVYCKNTPADWKVGGTISGTLTNCDWKLYVDKYTQKETWELCPADYSELTYKAPLTSCATPVITVAEDGAVSIACETAGATIHYTVGENPANPTEADAVFSAVTLTEGQTIKAIAVAEGYKPSAVASKKYTVGSETAKTYTLTFANSYGDTGTNGYTTSWEATRNGFTWTMANWNNNRYQNNWTFVRAGSKKAASVATITTNKAMPEAISTVAMTIDAITTTSVNSIKLDVLSADNNIKETITGEAKKGDCVFKITNPQQDCKYKITVDCQKGSGNGFVQVSKVVYTNN